MLEVVVVPFIPGRLTLMWTFESYQVILSIHIMWQRKRRCTWYCIRHALSHLIESLMRFVFCFLVTGQGKIILQIYCMPMVLRGVNRMNKCARAHHHKCNPLQHLDVMRSNLRNGWSLFFLHGGFGLNCYQRVEWHWHCGFNCSFMVKEFDHYFL